MAIIPYAVAIIIGFASTAYALRCHVCRSAIKSDCNDPFKATASKYEYTTDCNAVDNSLKVYPGFIPDLKLYKPIASGCLKLKIEAKGEIYTNRYCYFGDVLKYKESCQENEMVMRGEAKLLSCNVCIKHLCNSSTTTGVFAATVIFLIAIVCMIS